VKRLCNWGSHPEQFLSKRVVGFVHAAMASLENREMLQDYKEHVSFYM
jgi:hypothetical protein